MATCLLQGALATFRSAVGGVVGVDVLVVGGDGRWRSVATCPVL